MTMENIRKLTYKEVEDIVSNSNPQETEEDKQGTGFWLFAKEIQKSPRTYISEDSPYKPVYYGLFDNDNKTCIAMVCLTYNYPYGYENYPHGLIMQSIKKGVGIRLLQFVYRLVQKEGYNGITVFPINKDIAEKYKKLGFTYYDEPRMQKTFKNYINDSVSENLTETHINNIHKQIKRTSDGLEIQYNFGKNGLGISNDLYLIGKDIESYSKDYIITLTDPFFDSLDDIYSFKVIGRKKESIIKESVNKYDSFSETYFIQFLYLLEESIKTRNSQTIFRTIKNIYNIIQSKEFQNEFDINSIDLDDKNSTENQVFREIKRGFKFLLNDREYLDSLSDKEYDIYYNKIKTLISDYNNLCYSYLPIEKYKEYFSDCTLCENYLSGTYGDPTFSTNTPNSSYNTGYIYSIRNLDHSLEGNKQPNVPNYNLLHVGSYVSGKNKEGNIVYGRIYKIIKDSDGFIKKVYIFNKNAKIINVAIDSIIAVPNGYEYRNCFGNVDINTKVPIAESVKHNGTKSLSINGQKYLLTLNEGRVVVCELNNKKISSITDLYDIDNNLARKILNKI